MENPENDKIVADESCQLNRNRSFKTKQLVRSQALRETQSPPRTVSPCVVEPVKNSVNVINVITERNNVADNDRTITVSDKTDSEVNCCDEKKQQVEIQITGGGWEDSVCGQSQRGGWSSNKSESRDLLSNSPRVTCVCGACECPHCRGRRRQHQCPTKQDSGIVCDRDDASDNEITGSTPASDTIRKSASIDDECRCTERRDKRSHAFTRYDSESDLTGPELVRFIKETLNKNSRDRNTLLKIERELHELVNNNGRCVVRFPTMSSYGRMLVHRCATLFQLGHRLDPYNKTSVLVSKTGTSGGQIPCTQFKQWCTAAFPDIQHAPNINNNSNAKFILKRATQSLEECVSGSLLSTRSKSLEQRERDYQRVRSRIFSEENCASNDAQWPWLSSGPVKLLTPEGGRKLLKVQSLESSGGSSSGRGVVCKSHSFGGEPRPHRPLSTQGDLASSSWRLSPSSSGYKTLSLRSTDSVTPSPTGGGSPEPSPNVPSAVMWAVTDLARVPQGALVIHPQTGRPLSNPDGTLYHFDPANPPVIYDATTYEQTVELESDQNNDRRRGRLEKQNSFIANECDCQTLSEELMNKCCCEYRRSEQTHNNNDKNDTNPKPSSPNITYDNSNTPPNPPEPSNHVSPKKQIQPNNVVPKYETTNQKVDVKLTTNQQAVYNKPANEKVDYEPTNQVQNNEVDRHQLTNQSSQESFVPQTNYNTYNEEANSPPRLVNHVYSQPDMSLHPVQAKVAPMIHDPTMHQMSLSNMIYPAPVTQAYPYVNHYRSEQPIQQPVYQQVPDAHKQMIGTHTNETSTFRIDPSYPYPPVDYSQCGPCTYLEPTYNTTHRPGYNVNYGQMEVPNMIPTNMYTAPPVVLPPTHHYPYQDAIQWSGVQPMVNVHRDVSPKVMLHDIYPYCGLVCPPVSYGVCGSMFAGVHTDKAPSAGPLAARAHSLASLASLATSATSTPLPYNNDNRNRPDDRKVYNAPTTQRNPEITATIQQIKQQMAQLNTDNQQREQNTDNGILGSRPSHDESQLSSAARAIVNSIRNIQTKNNYNPDNRREQQRDRRRHDDKRTYRQQQQQQQQQQPHMYAQMHLTPAQLSQLAQQQRGGIGPNNWCRRSPAPVYPIMNHPRRNNPNGRNERR